MEVVNSNYGQTLEIKGSSDKRGWSFRKRSARHRVLSNSVTSETPSGNKASSDSATVSFQTQPSTTAVEKASVVQWSEEKTEEKSELSTPPESKVSEPPAPAPEDVTADVAPDESVIITIQAAIRGFLAQRMLLKHKSIIKLQAAVRGHIVRRHAVGSLRCVQAIVKMQALVRQRRAQLLLEEGKDNSAVKSHVAYSSSLQELLTNGFARQLLESKPRTKTINIKCDPSKSDSAWKWLERWMSVSSMGNQQSSETTSEHQEEKLDCQLENKIPSHDICESRDNKSNTEESVVPSEADENVITYEVDNFDSDACSLTLSFENHSTEKPSLNTGEAKSSDDTVDSFPGQARKSDVLSKMEPDPILDESEVENEQHIHHIKRPPPEEPETDGKKTLFGSRKASNPAFIAAQSKFEELTSSANSARLVGSSDQDIGMRPSIDAVSLTREIVPAENSLTHATGIEVGGSECGTELSISSTLDSPDRPEVGVVNDVKGNNNLEDETNNSLSSLNSAVNAEAESPVLEKDTSYANSVEQEKHDNLIGGEIENDSSAKLPDPVSSQVDQQPDITDTSLQIQLEPEISHRVSKSSPEASPRSHVTIPESQETPSSQVSMKNKKSSGGKSGSSNKRKSESFGKGYSSDANHNSGARNSSEHLPKDNKTAKRRNSFGSTKTDHGDHEPRDSSSSLPSYMQATESARAKAVPHSSPRSSPDMQDKDFHIKKRHSVPAMGANTRQGSPLVQQPASQALQGAKGNEIHSPQERKWRR